MNRMRMRNTFFSPVLFLTIFAIFFVPILSPASGAKPRLNVLLVTIDTLRPDRLSCYSSEHLKTPNIDGVAEEGVLFLRAFAHNPMTLPSHANILLGTTPLYHGIHDNTNFVVREEFLIGPFEALDEKIGHWESDYCASSYDDS